MTIIQAALDLLSKLDPTIGLDLEADFGPDWEKQLDAAVSAVQEDPKTVDMESIRRKYTVPQLKALARSAGLQSYSSLKEQELIDALLEQGIKL